MSDLIKRSDAIKALRLEYPMMPMFKSLREEWAIKTEGFRKAEEVIMSVPSADRPQGEWIDEADKYDASFGIHDYRCSNCNSYADEYIGGHEWYTAGKPNFCPCCGADMREREGE